MSNSIQDAINAFARGDASALDNVQMGDQTVESGQGVDDSIPSSWDAEIDSIEESDESTEEVGEVDSAEWKSSDASESADDSREESLSASSIEEIFVTDDKGRRKVKVDFSDRDKLKKLVAQSYGMRKFQKERDDALKNLKELQASKEELESTWSNLQEVYERQGVQGLVNLVAGEPNAYESHLQQQLERAQAKAKASPEQLKQIEALERAEQATRENELFKRKLEEREALEAQRREAMEVEALQTKLNAPFAKYAFTGKLGDSALEQQYNEALWNLATNRLRQLPEDAELTDQILDRTFREVALNFNKAVTKQVKEKTAKTAQRQKDKAATRVAAKARAGIPQVNAADSFKNDIKTGNWGQALAQVMSGKVRLK